MSDSDIIRHYIRLLEDSGFRYTAADFEWKTVAKHLHSGQERRNWFQLSINDDIDGVILPYKVETWAEEFPSKTTDHLEFHSGRLVLYYALGENVDPADSADLFINRWYDDIFPRLAVHLQTAGFSAQAAQDLSLDDDQFDGSPAIIYADAIGFELGITALLDSIRNRDDIKKLINEYGVPIIFCLEAANYTAAEFNSFKPEIIQAIIRAIQNNENEASDGLDSAFTVLANAGVKWPELARFNRYAG